MVSRKFRSGFLIAFLCTAMTPAVTAARPPRSATKPAVVKRARGSLQRAAVQRARATVLPQRLNIKVQEPRLFGGSGRVAGGLPGTNVYSNEIEPSVDFYSPGANQQMADDLELAAGACDIVYYNLRVFGDGRFGATFNVHTELWNGDPCGRICTGGARDGEPCPFPANCPEGTCDPTSVIAGTEADFPDVPNDGDAVTLLEAFFSDSPVAIPEKVWLAATFSVDGAGWIIAERAEVGVTDDLWSEDDTDPSPGCPNGCGCTLFFFRGDPYAGFWANVNCDLAVEPPGACCDGTTCTEVTEAECTGGTWQGAFTTCDPNPCQPGACCTGDDFTTCNDTTEVGCAGGGQLFHPDATCAEGPCLPGFKVYENDFVTGFFDAPDTGTMWADDLAFGPGLPCDLLAFDITMVGPDGTPDFDVQVSVWTNDDRGTPTDETDDIPLAPITMTITDFAGVPADQLGHTLLAGPFDGITLLERAWIVFSTSSDQVAPLRPGPLLAGIADVGFSRDAFAIFNAPGNLGVWTFFDFGGFNPTCCPGGAIDCCVAAGSFQINVWCAGEEPTGACCNDAAGTCVNRVPLLLCDGRWAEAVTCDSEPFEPPCGTNACCTQFGCTDTSRTQCSIFVGSIIPGLFCADVTCPRNECIGADGSCFEGNGSPGCDDALCCGTVCALDDRCCTLEWDAVCANEAADFCATPPPANDHCGNAEAISAAAISGAGVFDFDNSTATTDGSLHVACLDASEEPHITHDVWYCWTADCTDTVYIRTCGLTEVDTKIAVYEGCDACPPTDEALLACNDDFCGFQLAGQQSQVSFGATAGQSHLIRIGTFPGAEGGVGMFSISCGLPDKAACVPGTGNCCTDTDNPGCSDGLCCETVCACDPFCCEVEWDEFCGGLGNAGSGCGAEALCQVLCGTQCPGGDVIWLSPPDGVIDARQTHPPNDPQQLQGIVTINVSAPLDAARSECWELCETANTGLENGIDRVTVNGDDTLTITLLRPITPGAVTTITYLGSGATASFIAHPGNVNRDGFSNAADITAMLDCVANAVAGAEACDEWQCDADHSNRCTPADVLRVIDIENGAAQHRRWMNSQLPIAAGICP